LPEWQGEDHHRYLFGRQIWGFPRQFPTGANREFVGVQQGNQSGQTGNIGPAALIEFLNGPVNTRGKIRRQFRSFVPRMSIEII
jgi:hypothetical protein